MPIGVLTNDILLLFIETSDQAITVSGGTETWTAVTGSPVTGAVGTDLTVVTTTVADTFIVHAIAGDGPDGNSTVNLSGKTNLNLSNLIERSDDMVNTGDGELLGTYTGEKATARW